jgi:glucose/arabinose dehydrogenase
MPLVAAALVNSTSTIAIAQTGMNTTSLQHSVVLEGLENPWDMAFLNDGTMFFTEKCKGLSVRMPSGEVKKPAGHERQPRLCEHRAWDEALELGTDAGHERQPRLCEHRR